MRLPGLRRTPPVTPPPSFGRGTLPQRRRKTPPGETTCKDWPDPYGPDPIVFGPRSDKQAPEELP